MNSLPAKIIEVQVSGNLSLVSVEIGTDLVLKTIVVETPDSASYLQKGKEITALFKETEVIIGTKANSGTSLQNSIPGTIQKIEKGELLSKLVLNTPVGEITSILGSNAIKELGLELGQTVTAMVKLNEIMLSTK